MTRRSFGGQASDFVTNSRGDTLSGGTGRVYTAQTGGSQITDLLDANGLPVTTLAAALSPKGMVQFSGPNDGTSVVWVDFGQGRVKMVDSEGTMRVDSLIVNVKDHGVVGDGTTDDTAAIQALADALLADKGALYFPAGVYKVSSPITLTVSGATIQGSGRGTQIISSSATANIFTVSVANVTIRDLWLKASVTRSAGYYVDVTSAGTRFRLQNFWMTGANGGVRTASAATATIQGGQILDCVASTGVGIRVDGGTDVSIRDILMDASSQIFAGIHVTACGDLTIEDCNLIHAGSALFINPLSGQTVSSLWANNTFFDTSTVGLHVFADLGSVRRIKFSQCWFSSHTAQGVRIRTTSPSTVQGVEFTGCQVFANASNGIQIEDVRTTDWQINGGAIAGNTSSGVSIAAGCTDFSVRNCRIGPYSGFGANGFGMFISAGASNNYAISNNDVRGNTSNSIVDNGTGTTKKLNNNLGYNPRGNLGPPTVPATTVVLTNPYGVDCSVYVAGGTVTVIAVDGTTTGLTVGLIPVPAGSTITLTYTVAPTWKWLGA